MPNSFHLETQAYIHSSQWVASDSVNFFLFPFTSVFTVRQQSPIFHLTVLCILVKTDHTHFHSVNNKVMRRVRSARITESCYITTTFYVKHNLWPCSFSFVHLFFHKFKAVINPFTYVPSRLAYAYAVLYYTLCVPLFLFLCSEEMIQVKLFNYIR